jgi:hypothetical protein
MVQIIRKPETIAKNDLISIWLNREPFQAAKIDLQVINGQTLKPIVANLIVNFPPLSLGNDSTGTTKTLCDKVQCRKVIAIICASPYRHGSDMKYVDRCIPTGLDIRSARRLVP